jgi:hypothetical protein
MARGLRDTHYFLKTPAVGGKVQTIQSVQDCSIMACSWCRQDSFFSFFDLCGVAAIYFRLIDTAIQRKWYMPRCPTGMAANFLLRNPNGRLAGPAHLLPLLEFARILSGGTTLQPCVLFCSKNRKSRRDLVLIAPSKPMIECHREVRGRAT